jgi:heptosyltransferase-2
VTASQRFQRFLVIKLADLGDAVLALPAVQALRDTYPRARIDVLTTPVGSQVFRLSGVVDDVILLDKSRYERPVHTLDPRGWLRLLHLAVRLQRGRYDAVFLLHHLTVPSGRLKYRALLAATGASVRAGLDNGTGSFLTHPVPDLGFGTRPEWHYALEVVKTVGVTAGASPPRLVLPDAARREAAKMLAGCSGNAPLVVLHPGVGPYGPGRAWPPGHFATLAQGLLAAGCQVAATGTERERPMAAPLLAVGGVLDLLGRTSVATLAAVLERASLIVGADSGALHLASAVGTRVLALFGPSNAAAWAPYAARIQRAGDPPQATTSIALHAGLPCAPCFYVGYRLGRPAGCRQRTCLEAIDPAIVLRTALALLEHRGTEQPESASPVHTPDPPQEPDRSR